MGVFQGVPPNPDFFIIYADYAMGRYIKEKDDPGLIISDTQIRNIEIEDKFTERMASKMDMAQNM